jgi:hypothetical protein
MQQKVVAGMYLLCCWFQRLWARLWKAGLHKQVQIGFPVSLLPQQRKRYIVWIS